MYRKKDKAASAAKKPPTDWKRELRHILFLALAVMGIWSFIGKPFFIPSESMVPTLLVGDRLVVTKYPYGYSYLSPFLRILPKMEGRLLGSYPDRGDIVVLKDPVKHADWIKRVIGLPGDTVQMRGGTLYLNGDAIPKQRIAPTEIIESPNQRCSPRDTDSLEQRLSYRNLEQFKVVRPDGVSVCRYPRFIETLPNGRRYEVLDLFDNPGIDNTRLFTVPDGHIFVMGDNRDRSADSRFATRSDGLGGLGLLPIENVSGRAEFITFSLDGSLNYINPISWYESLRTERAGETLRRLPDSVETE
nr:signal peptidase I [Pacificimonas pallii]